MKEFVEKLISRLEEEKKMAYNTYVNYEMNVDMGRMRGIKEAIEIVNQLAEEYKDNVMINGQYCWQTCGATEHCKECNRLCNGGIDYYENYDVLAEEYNNGWIPASQPPEIKKYDDDKTGVVILQNKYGEINIGTYKQGSFHSMYKKDPSYLIKDDSIVYWQPFPKPITISDTWKQHIMDRFERME